MNISNNYILLRNKRRPHNKLTEVQQDDVGLHSDLPQFSGLLLFLDLL